MASAFGDLRGRALWVVLGCLVCQMGLGFLYGFAPVIADIIDELGWTRAEYSSASATRIWAISLASPAVGYLTVRFGGRSVLVVSTVILGLAFVGLAVMQSWLQFVALTVLLGLAVTGLGDISVGGVVTQWVTRGRGFALGLVYTGSNLGGFLVSRAVAALAEQTSWRQAFAVLGVAGVGLILPFALFAVRDREAPAAPAGAAAAPVSRVEDGGSLDLRAALGTRSFWVIGLTLFASFLFLVSILEHFVLFLQDGGLSRGEAAGYYSTAVGMGLVSKVAFGWLADWLRPRAALALEFGLLGLSSWILLWLPQPALLPLFVAMFGLAYAARDVVTPLIVTDCFGTRYLAQIYGALMLTLLPAGTLGPVLAALAHDRLGSYAVAFTTFAVLNALSFASLALLRDERG